MEKNDVGKLKNKICNLGLLEWKNNNFKCVNLAATGVGKTKQGVIAACEFIKRSLNSDRIEKSLICVPRINLIEHWRKEIIKWGYENCLDHVSIVCNNSSVKFYNEINIKFDTLVIDECHRVANNSYSKIISKGFKRILCLSATLSKKDIDFFKNKFNLNVGLNFPYKSAIESGIIVKPTITVKEFKLYDDEELKLDEFTGSINICKSKVKHDLDLKDGENMDYYSYFKGLMDKELYSHKHYRLATIYIKAVNQRKELLYNLKSREDKLLDQLVELLKDDNHKIIVFSERTTLISNIYEKLKDEYEDKMLIVTSKLKKKDVKKAIELFEEPFYKLMLSAKMLEEGYDVPDCNVGIIASFNTSNNTIVQRIGRVLRQKEDKVAKIYILQSDTKIEKNWLKNTKL